MRGIGLLVGNRCDRRNPAPNADPHVRPTPRASRLLLQDRGGARVSQTKPPKYGQNNGVAGLERIRGRRVVRTLSPVTATHPTTPASPAVAMDRPAAGRRTRGGRGPPRGGATRRSAPRRWPRTRASQGVPSARAVPRQRHCPHRPGEPAYPPGPWGDQGGTSAPRANCHRAPRPDTPASSALIAAPQSRRWFGRVRPPRSREPGPVRP